MMTSAAILLVVITITHATTFQMSKKSIFPDGVWCMFWSGASECAKDYFKQYYDELTKANCLNCDKYFHCKANYETACGICNDSESAKKLSDCRDDPSVTDADSLADRVANAFGRNCNDCEAKYLCANNCSYNPHDKTCQRSNCP